LTAAPLPTPAPVSPDAQAVLDFWFGAAGSPHSDTLRPMWFTKSDATDREIGFRFGALIEQALRGELAGWTAQPLGALARIIVLDQFTRNVFRGTPRAFAGDARALAAASDMVASGFDAALPPAQRAFVYLPFEHAEDLALQDAAVQHFSRLAEAAPELQGMLDYAQKHRAVIARFGRFPHRNAIIGRRSSAQELAFLKEPGSSF